MTVAFISAKITTCEDGSFGIVVEGEEKTFYRSLCRDRAKVERLVRLINSGEVSRLHIDDIIEDFLE
ncbi:MAG: hypothetical protein IJD74_00955 [Clostridia bacterium]|nr:hypothetical protein [Clostridia bacterium]MBR4031323.1 hypothetical protein [Clostridia bacterium]